MRTFTILVLCCMIPAAAVADPAPVQTVSTGPVLASEGNVPSASPSVVPAERVFLFIADPSLPAPGRVVLSAGMGNVTRTGEERPVGSGAIMPTLGAEIGVVPRLSFYVDTSVVFWGQPLKGNSPVSVEAGPRILLTDPRSRELLLTIEPAYGLNFTGNSTLLINVAFAWQTGILRLAASAIISHTFQSDADPADVQASAGASVSLPFGLLAGLEGVVTDLEEVGSPEAEGGASAFVGPTIGWGFGWEHRLQIVAGPAYGFGPNYSGFLGRASASAQF